MHRIISALFFLITATALNAQSLITRSFHDIPLSKALVEIDQSTDEQHIVFVYDELEDFIVEGTFKDTPITQVIKTLIGYYPIHIETEGDKIFVECTQKEPYHLRGRIVSENGSPLTNVNIAIIEHDSIIGGGRSNAGGQFVIPHTAASATMGPAGPCGGPAPAPVPRCRRRAAPAAPPAPGHAQACIVKKDPRPPP